MSETTERKPEEIRDEKTTDTGSETDAGAQEARVASVPRRASRTAVIAVAITAIVATALLLWWLSSRPEGNGAGRPVPAPRTIAIDQPNTGSATQPPAGGTLTLTPEAATRAGIRVEMVGEQLSAESGGGAATGVVQANTYRTTPVVALVGGIVRRVNGELGENVQRGQPLVVITSDELATAQSAYLTAFAELDERRRNHNRTANLVEIGAASRQEFEEATTRLRSSEAEIARVRQRLLLLGLTPQRADALRSSSQINSEVTLASPISGTVIGRAVNPGEVIEANREILRVADLSSVWVIGQVFERELARVRVGSGASITTAAYPGRVFRGRISYIDPSLDQATRTAQARIELANPGGVLRLGMFVQIAFGALGEAERTVPVIPIAAVQNINNQQVVFVATDDPSVFALRPVRLGTESNGRFPVLEGLSVGERIVTDGSFLLRAEWLKLHPSG